MSACGPGKRTTRNEKGRQTAGPFGCLWSSVYSRLPMN